MTNGVEQTRDADGESAPKVSKLVVRTLTYFTGRGPETTNTRFGEDFVVVVVRGILTKPERMLVEAGHGARVLDLRRTLDDLMAPSLIEGMETITGRAVGSLLSATQLAPDISVHTFLFDATRPLPEGLTTTD